MIFLDTNVFVRYVTFDDPVKGEACAELIESLELSGEAATSEIVLAEVVFVLSGVHYRMDRTQISEFLRALIALRGLRIPDKRRILRAVDYFETVPQLSFADCLIASQVSENEDIEVLISYDRDYDRIAGFARMEPHQLNQH
jgi:predicted nucleic acid-binding protein